MIQTTEPLEFVAGDRVKWTKDLADYLPSLWTLTYTLVKSGSKIDITATDNGDGTHLVNLAPATTAGYTAGKYHWQAYVSDADDRYLVDSGTMEIKPNFATQTGGYDDRSHVKTVLDAIEAVIEGRATKDQMSYSIAGRTLELTPIPDLIVLREKYKAEYASEVRAERIANGLGHNGKILVRF